MIMSRWGSSRRWLVGAAAVTLLLAGAVYLCGSRQSHVAVVPDASVDRGTEQGGAEGAPERMPPVREVASALGSEAADVNVARTPDSEPNHSVAGEAAVVAHDGDSTPIVPPRFPPLGYVIKGRVLSKDGLVREDPNQWPPSRFAVEVSAPGYLRECSIDEQGGFECSGLGESSYTVEVRGAPGHLRCRPVEVLLGPQNRSREVALFLSQTVPLWVQVLEEDTQLPVDSCYVAATSVDGPGRSSAIVDPQGCCVLNLLPGEYRVSAGGDESNSRPVFVQSSGNPMVTLLAPASKEKMIRLVLEDTEGNRVKGYVDLGGVEWEPDTQPADSFTAPEPTYMSFDGFVGYASDVSGALARQFTWSRDDLDKEVAVVLEPRAQIVGEVIDVNGQPVPDADLGLLMVLPNDARRSVDDSLYTRTVDRMGRFRLGNLAVGLSLQVTAYSGPISGRSDVLDLEAGTTVNAGRIVLTAPERRRRNAVVKGRITDETGQPAADYTVIVSARYDRGTPLAELARPYVATLDPRTMKMVAKGEFRTDAEGCFAATGLPENGPITVTATAPDGRAWFRTVTGSIEDCDIELHAQGLGILGEEAPALVVDRWVNHVPVTWEDLRGRVVVLAFLGVPPRHPQEWPFREMGALYRQYTPNELFMVAVFDGAMASRVEVEGGNPIGEENAVRYVVNQCDGAPIAGCFDADPNLVRDVMPAARPAGAAAGATHWLYQVSKPCTMFLIDKRGRIRYCVQLDGLAERVKWLLDE
jgi:hypothetical protein